VLQHRALSDERVGFADNTVEQDHRAIKRMVRAMLEFKAFWSAEITIAGIEIAHMIRKGQLRSTGKFRPALQFHSKTISCDLYVIIPKPYFI
jgi:putative transposase